MPCPGSVRPFLIALALLSLAAVASARPAGAQELRLVVGVRDDAPPFAYRAAGDVLQLSGGMRGPLERAGYGGYMVLICDRALLDLQLSGYQDLEVVAKPVVAGTRFDDLREGRIDILCDPATIQPNRLEGLLVSPPTYLSGVSYVSQPLSQLPRSACGTLAGLVAGTTADAGLRAILAAGEWPAYRPVIEAYLDGGKETLRPDPACEGGPVAPVLSFETHDALADAFCAGEVAYYVGDMEIVTAVLGRRGGCPFEGPFKTFSDERYAVYARIPPDPETAKAVLTFFSHLGRNLLGSPSILDQAFEATFPTARPSQKLSLFFWSLRGPPAARRR